MTLHRHRHSYLQECIDSMDFQWRQGSLTFHVYISFYLRTTCVFWCFGVLGKCYLIRPCLGSSKLDGLPSFEVQPHNFSFCERALPVTEVRSAFSALYQWQGTSTRRRCQLLFYKFARYGCMRSRKSASLAFTRQSHHAKFLIGAFYPKLRASGYDLDEETKGPATLNEVRRTRQTVFFRLWCLAKISENQCLLRGCKASIFNGLDCLSAQGQQYRKSISRSW